MPERCSHCLFIIETIRPVAQFLRCSPRRLARRTATVRPRSSRGPRRPRANGIGLTVRGGNLPDEAIAGSSERTAISRIPAQIAIDMRSAARTRRRFARSCRRRRIRRARSARRLSISRCWISNWPLRNPPARSRHPRQPPEKPRTARCHAAKPATRDSVRRERHLRSPARSRYAPRLPVPETNADARLPGSVSATAPTPASRCRAARRPDRRLHGARPGRTPRFPMPG